MNSINRSTILLSLLAFSGHALTAEPIQDPVDNAAESENIQAHNPNQAISFEATIKATASDHANFDSDIGEFKRSHIEASISASRRIGSSSMLSVEFGAGLLNYDIDPSATSVAGDAADIGSEFDDITTLSLMGIFADRTDEGHSWFIGGGAISNSEQDADFGDSVDGIITGGFGYRVSNELEIGLGVVARTRLDDDALIVPFPQLKYSINEFWSINSEGAGLRINYKASEAVDYGVYGKFQSTTFRLDDSHAFASEGMATHRSFPLAFFAHYSPNDTIKLKGSVGAMIGGELEILDTAGNDVASQDIDPGIFGTLSVSISF